tara:strand:- start:638 stop:1537 length:900 start_codon:yes stop_codon:yes gene_type:complete
MDIYEDSRLVSLNSKDAVKLNGEYNSNVFFNIPNIVAENEDVEFILSSVEDFEMPISYYLINDTNDTLHYVYNSTPFTIVLSQGNYNGSTIISEMKQKFTDNNLEVTIVLSSITGRLTFKFSNPVSEVVFNYELSRNLMTLLGFKQTVQGVAITAPDPMNLLGIMKINICSLNLATFNSFTSSGSLSNNLIQTVAINLPSWHQLTYVNKTSHSGRLKTNYLDNIDIQLYDDAGNFLELNNIDWSMTLQIRVFRRFSGKTLKMDMNTFLPKVQTKQKETKPDEKEEGKTGNADLDLLLEK